MPERDVDRMGFLIIVAIFAFGCGRMLGHVDCAATSGETSVVGAAKLGRAAALDQKTPAGEGSEGANGDPGWHAPFTLALPIPSTLYANCAAVRAAGAFPLMQSDPGYATALDSDRNGVACDEMAD